MVTKRHVENVTESFWTKFTARAAAIIAGGILIPLLTWNMSQVLGKINAQSKLLHQLEIQVTVMQWRLDRLESGARVSFKIRMKPGQGVSFTDPNVSEILKRQLDRENFKED